MKKYLEFWLIWRLFWFNTDDQIFMEKPFRCSKIVVVMCIFISYCSQIWYSSMAWIIRLSGYPLVVSSLFCIYISELSASRYLEQLKRWKTQIYSRQLIYLRSKDTYGSLKWSSNLLTTCLAVQSYGKPRILTITAAPRDRNACASQFEPPATERKSSPDALYTSMYRLLIWCLCLLRAISLCSWLTNLTRASPFRLPWTDRQRATPPLKQKEKIYKNRWHKKRCYELRQCLQNSDNSDEIIIIIMLECTLQDFHQYL